MMDLRQVKIAVIGLGYVGLPLALEFGKKYNTVGYDVDGSRIKELIEGFDRTLECSSAELKDSSHMELTADPKRLRSADVYIITVPTPIDDSKNPDLTYLIQASRFVGSVLSEGNFVVYESTVYPGATEEVCIPQIEDASGLKLNKNFYVGYSPERINPGDKSKKLADIVKVTSGSSEEAATFIDSLYSSVVTSGTYRASSIKVAEAAKVIENTQRDVNIALINELSVIFEMLGISTFDVLEAAGTKWNFLPFKPGLVGGHCIGVDPYYLAYKAQAVGYHPDMVLAGRRINDGMPEYWAGRIIKQMILADIKILGSNMLLLGVTFKENCPDVRNSKVFALANYLEDFGVRVSLHDPWANSEQVKKVYDRDLEASIEGKYDCVVLAVEHDCFFKTSSKGVLDLNFEDAVIVDFRGSLSTKG